MKREDWSNQPVAYIKHLDLEHMCQNVVHLQKKSLTPDIPVIIARKRRFSAVTIMQASGEITQNLPKSAQYYKKNVARASTDSLLSVVENSSTLSLGRKQASMYIRQHVNNDTWEYSIEQYALLASLLKICKENDPDGVYHLETVPLSYHIEGAPLGAQEFRSVTIVTSAHINFIKKSNRSPSIDACHLANKYGGIMNQATQKDPMNRPGMYALQICAGNENAQKWQRFCSIIFKLCSTVMVISDKSKG
jgi:hypothetical protein